MLNWLNDVDFESNVNVDEFLDSVQFIAGTVVDGDRELFDHKHYEINEPQYFQKAWRWFGNINNKYFYLDVAANDVRQVIPMSFYLYTHVNFLMTWKRIEEARSVLSAIGTVQIDHVTSRVERANFTLFRSLTTDGLSRKANVLYHGAIEEDIRQFGEYLMAEFNDTDLFIGRRL